MKSKKENNKYIIKTEYEKFPLEFPVDTFNHTLTDLKKDLSNVQNMLKDLYETDSSLFYFLRDELFEPSCISVNEGKIWKLDSLINDISKMEQELKTNNDEITPKEDLVTLYDIGFYLEYPTDKTIFVKKIKDDDDLEIVDEIIIYQLSSIYRRRRIQWKKTKYGKSSQRIVYEDLKTNEELNKIIDNTRKELEKNGIFKPS